jgi:mycothiol synthase
MAAAFTPYLYSGQHDQREMAALVRQHSREHLHAIDLPYRLASWAFDDPDNCKLWRDSSGELVAWAVLQSPFWTVDIACRPNLDALLFPEILGWAEDTARRIAYTLARRPAWFVNVFPHQHTRITALEMAGWGCQSDAGADSWSQVLLERDAAQSLPQIDLPPGFTLRTLAGPTEAAAYVALHQAVFESKNMTLPWRRRTLQQPEYRPELDLVIAAPGGELAAFCIGWLASDRPCAQIEPMGVAPEYRGLNLGRIILSECLQRMHDLGARRVVILTDNYRGPALGLYESAGFQDRETVLVYRIIMPG